MLRTLGTSIFGAIFATTALAEQPDYCAPAIDMPGFKETSTEVKQAVYTVFAQAATPVFYRRACGLTDESDLEYLDVIAGTLGCDPGAWRVPFFSWAHRAPLSDLGFVADETWMWGDGGDFATYCKIVAGVPWPIELVDGALPQETKDALKTSMHTLGEYQATHARPPEGAQQ